MRAETSSSSFRRPCRYISTYRGMSTRNRFEPMTQPWMRFSRRKSGPGSSMIAPIGIMPMTVAVPPRFNMAKHCSAVAFRPMASKAWSTPSPPVSSITFATASPLDASTRSVAPNCSAIFSLVATPDVGHVRANRLDDAGRLVTEHRGGRVDVLALDEVQVAVAHPGGRRPDQHLAGTGRVERHLLDHERRRDLSEHGCLHGYPLDRGWRANRIRGALATRQWGWAVRGRVVGAGARQAGRAGSALPLFWLATTRELCGVVP